MTTGVIALIVWVAQKAKVNCEFSSFEGGSSGSEATDGEVITTIEPYQYEPQYLMLLILAQKQVHDCQQVSNSFIQSFRLNPESMISVSVLVAA